MKALRAKPDNRPAPDVVKADQRSRSAVEYVAVGPQSDGQRLDNFLQARFRSLPKSLIHRIIRTGQVRVNGGRSKAEQKVVLGDQVRLPPLDLDPARAASSAAQPPPREFADGELVVVHEDESLILLDKPAGLAVHGGSGISAGLIERLRASRPTAPFLELAHRLDRDTSGLLLVAKTRPALVSLHRMLADGKIRKHYRALVKGYWGRSGAALLQFPLERHVVANGERRVRVHPDGQAAATRVSLIRHWPSDGIVGFPPSLSLLNCELLTGRTHQIRVHLTQAGFPLLGDQKYGDFTLNKLLEKHKYKRMFLHAFSIEFEHPTSARMQRFQAAQPALFDQLERALSVRRDRPLDSI